MSRHQVADRGQAPQIWKVADNILYKLSLIADKGWFFTLKKILESKGRETVRECRILDNEKLLAYITNLIL